MAIEDLELEFNDAWDALNKARRQFQNHMITDYEFVHVFNKFQEICDAIERYQIATNYEDDADDYE